MGIEGIEAVVAFVDRVREHHHSRAHDLRYAAERTAVLLVETWGAVKIHMPEEPLEVRVAEAALEKITRLDLEPSERELLAELLRLRQGALADALVAWALPAPPAPAAVEPAPGVEPAPDAGDEERCPF